jgi:DNA-binding SARP family transcriptional activator
MGLLRLAVLGPPEVFHDSCRLTFALRKVHAMLLYLAVEGGLHPRNKLAAFLWPDSDPHDARTSLRNALLLLRSLLADPDTTASQQYLSLRQGAHLHSRHDALGLNPQAPFELDLHMVQQAYHQAQLHSTTSSLEQRAALVTQFERALVRGPFLDGFWLGEDAPFDEWREQRLWQVRLQLLLDRLSSWQETGGELEPATATLTSYPRGN